MYGYLAFVRGTATVVAESDLLVGISRRGFIVCEGMAEGCYFDGQDVKLFSAAFVCTVNNKVIGACFCAGCSNCIFFDNQARGVLCRHSTRGSECTVVFRGICLCRGAVITADNQLVRFLNGACAVVNFTVRIVEYNTKGRKGVTGDND